MTEKDFWYILGRALQSLDGSDELKIRGTIGNMEALLSDADEADFFGTEGWRHHIFDEQ